MRAINSQQAVSCEYVSLSSGQSKREIVPHALVNNGHRWHVRAFDRKSKEFRDFVCTRLQNVTEIKQHAVSNIESIALDRHELRSSDHQWNKVVQVTLKPHPSIKYKKAIELDYDMDDGQLILEVRASLLGYLLRQWNVDCTVDSSLKGNEYQLWLSNVGHVKIVLEGLAELTIAPGYGN